MPICVFVLLLFNFQYFFRAFIVLVRRTWSSSPKLDPGKHWFERHKIIRKNDLNIIFCNPKDIHTQIHTQTYIQIYIYINNKI